MYKAPDTLLQITLKMAAGVWVPVCRINAERLVRLAHVEVQVKPFMKTWRPMDDQYSYAVRMQFRARNRRIVDEPPPAHGHRAQA